jgi:hypothetical protein
MLTACALALLVGGCAVDPADRDDAADPGEALELEDTGVVEQGLAEATCGRSIFEIGVEV